MEQVFHWQQSFTRTNILERTTSILGGRPMSGVIEVSTVKPELKGTRAKNFGLESTYLTHKNIMTIYRISSISSTT